jgi:uncharacterized protein (TIGR03083 family)
VGTRPLRQHYDGVDAAVDARLCPSVEPWMCHRRRFVDALEALDALDAEQWHAPTRCSEWDVHDVVAHITSADGFWVMTLGNARAGGTPGKYLEGFDPSSSLEPFVDALRVKAGAELLQQFRDSTDAFVACIADMHGDDWHALAESPLGHLETRFLFQHAFWDSWLHERDIFVALGSAPPVDADELRAATVFTCFIGAIEGGLMEDPAPVGPLLDRPIDVTLRFDDLATPLHVQIDKGVSIEPATEDAGEPAGSALDFVERLAGRDAPHFDALPDADFAAHLERAAQIL